MDRYSLRPMLVARVGQAVADSVCRFAKAVRFAHDHWTNDDYSYSIGRYEPTVKPLDIRAAAVRLSASFA